MAIFHVLSICLVCTVARAKTATLSESPDIVGHSDIYLALRPPKENAKDIQVAMDELMKSEEFRRQTSQSEFTADRHRMLEAEKMAMHEVVMTAMRPMTAEGVLPAQYRHYFVAA